MNNKVMFSATIPENLHENSNQKSEKNYRFNVFSTIHSTKTEQ